MAQGEYYWCLKHGTVEEYQGCKATDRLGPYPTREQAAAALERVADRNEEWDDDDEAWQDGRPDDGRA